jgi:hypothetical protein
MGGAAMLAGATIFGENATPYIPWRSVKDGAVELDSVWGAISPEHTLNIGGNFTYVEGRTALLISKTLDMARILGGDVAKQGGSVVMGAAHSVHANELVHDSDRRRDSIRRHTGIMLKKASRSSDTFTGKWAPHERRKWVVENQMHLLLFRVLEPDEKHFKRNPRTELKRIIQLEDKFVSPSVKRAVDDIEA